MTPEQRQQYATLCLELVSWNNPAAVSNKLFALGVLPENRELGPEETYATLAQLYNTGQFRLVREATRVPYVNTAGNWTVDVVESMKQSAEA